jgi:phage-related protein
MPDEIEDVDNATKLFDAKTAKDRPSLPAGSKKRSSSNRRQIWDEKELKIREIISTIRRIKEDVNEIEIEDVSLLNSLADAKRRYVRCSAAESHWYQSHR